MNIRNSYDNSIKEFSHPGDTLNLYADAWNTERFCHALDQALQGNYFKQDDAISIHLTDYCPAEVCTVIKFLKNSQVKDVLNALKYATQTFTIDVNTNQDIPLYFVTSNNYDDIFKELKKNNHPINLRLKLKFADLLSALNILKGLPQQNLTIEFICPFYENVEVETIIQALSLVKIKVEITELKPDSQAHHSELLLEAFNFHNLNDNISVQAQACVAFQQGIKNQNSILSKLPLDILKEIYSYVISSSLLDKLEAEKKVILFKNIINAGNRSLTFFNRKQKVEQDGQNGQQRNYFCSII